MEFGIEVWNLILIRLKNRCDEHESACRSESIWTCKLNLQTRVDICYHHFKQTNKYATSHENTSQTWRWHCIFTISKTVTFQTFHRSLQIQCCQLSWGGVNAVKLRETLGWYKWIRGRIACTCLEKWIDGSSMVLFSANNRAADISVRPITYSVLSIFARWRGNRQSLTEEFPTGKWSYFCTPFVCAPKMIVRCCEWCATTFFGKGKRNPCTCPCGHNARRGVEVKFFECSGWRTPQFNA